MPMIICDGIYTAIMTDTGSFRHNNTTVKCHEIAIDCIQNGIDYTGIYKKVYESHSRNRMELLGKILANLHYENNGELAWFVIDRDLLQSTQANKEDVDGFTDIVRTIRGVEVAVMIFQNEEKFCRVNFRSKGKYVIGHAARSLGGGGHDMAAGTVVEGKLNEVIEKVLAATMESMDSQKSSK